MELTEAYKKVFTDMATNYGGLFLGKYDAKNGNPEFMYGILLAMDFLATKAGNEDFEDLFIDNMIASKQKAQKERIFPSPDHIEMFDGDGRAVTDVKHTWVVIFRTEEGLSWFIDKDNTSENDPLYTLYSSIKYGDEEDTMGYFPFCAFYNRQQSSWTLADDFMANNLEIIKETYNKL